MSGEYAGNEMEGTLVDKSAVDTGDQTNPKPQGGGDQRKLHDDDYATKNYPPAGDTTSSGGYGSPQNVWSDGAQRGRANVYSGEDGAGLIDQSLSGGDLKDEIQDAKQGAAGTSISKAKADYHPSKDGRKEAQDMLDASYRDKS